MEIEYLLFEQVIIATGANLTEEEYQRCVKDGSIEKALRRIVPDYKKLRKFTVAVASIDSVTPKLIEWDPQSLMKASGKLLAYLHWQGVQGRTTEDTDWAARALKDARSIVEPIWTQISSRQNGILHRSQMTPEILALWKRYRDVRLDLASVRFRLDYLLPALSAKYAP